MVEKVVEQLKARFADALGDVVKFRDETTVWVKREALLAVARWLRDDIGAQFNLLVDVCGLDYPDQDPRFRVIYHLYSIPLRHRLRLQVGLAEDDAVAPSVVPIWPGANWYEREVFDLFGIRFEGHPDLRRIVMPDDWEGHPLRKDYPLTREEVAFSFSQAEITHRKPLARE